MFSYCMNNPVMYADPLGHNRNAILDELDLLFNEPDWASSYSGDVLERFLNYASNNYFEYSKLENHQKLELLDYYYYEWLNYTEKTWGDIMYEAADVVVTGLNDPLIGGIMGGVFDKPGTAGVYVFSVFGDLRDYGQTPSSFGTAFLITTTTTLAAAMVAGVLGGEIIVGAGVGWGFTVIAGIFKEYFCK